MTDAMKVRPFRIEVPEDALVDLYQRLDRTRWPDELADAGWIYGVSLPYLKDLVHYWRHEYDWRRHEARLNTLPQFTTVIDGAQVHFVHVRSPEPDALPLVITHGWPGSIVELLGVLGPLSDPRSFGGDPADAFDVVAPSIPGFGFSGPTREPGWDVVRVARAWAELMNRLDYRRYGAQGGDWGSRISWELGRQAPEHVVGVHVNMLVAADPPDCVELTPEEQLQVERRRRFNEELSGYMLVQATRPQTLAYALTDSPVGQLAWIVERFKEWTDSDEVPEDAISRDDLLTDVMLYWLTGTAGSSARLYYEFRRTGVFGPPEPTSIPTGVAVFAHDIAQPIRRFAEDQSNIVHWSEFDRGGHFAAMEEPDLLVGDVRAFFGGLR
jgi:pimeloyl-ACP methyl ester carboxylesterase